MIETYNQLTEEVDKAKLEWLKDFDTASGFIWARRIGDRRGFALACQKIREIRPYVLSDQIRDVIELAKQQGHP